MMLSAVYNSAKVKCVGNTYMYLYIVGHIIIRTLTTMWQARADWQNASRLNIKEELNNEEEDA